MSANFKVNCGEHEHQQLPEKCTETVYDAVTSKTVDENAGAAQITKRKTRKPRLHVAKKKKPVEKRLLCELEEPSETSANAKHLYSCTFSDPYDIQNLIRTKAFSPFRKVQLSLKARDIKRAGKIDKLLSADAIRTKLVPYNFQMQTALQVINEMNGNAILADEVGLGKTIEAGLIMKELLLREEINSVLIVSPKSLLLQWKTEMHEKFGEAFSIANIPREHVDLQTSDRIICSHNLLTRKYDQFASRIWDLIVVDEAHTFRNSKSKGRTCLENLRKSHFLLLTATPLCNRLTDLYSIVDLIQPGLLDSERSFVSRFAKDTKSRVVRPEEVHALRQTIRAVMCRTRREQTGIPFTKRCVDSRTLEANKLEREFIDQATEYLRGISQNQFKTIETLMAENPTRRISESQSRAILVFQAISLQQSFSSSPYASIESLTKRQQRFPQEMEVTSRLIEMAAKVKSTKMELLRNVLNEMPTEQALIFCLRKITVRKLKEMLNAEFGRAEVYLGDMSQTERDEVIESFQNGGTKYLVATDAASEGLNLQNCCVLFNYDLHWNPMKIEQRIGRIHRFKQDRDVTVFNLSVKDTIDDYVLHILYQKIDLFTMTIGKMETVLAELKEGSQDIQKTIAEILLRSNSRLDIRRELEKLATDLNVSKKNQELAEKFTAGILG
ncbi:MAG: DEAD/DEAH box helicase [Candidatus Bathyarchaeota archaeon]|nr:DEAD/DEAH box helicase [Candidatus Bathyarchaeota archaeon]